MANIDKTAMLTGWLVGRKVAGMMKPQEAQAQWETIFDGEATTVLGGVSSTAYSGVKIDNTDSRFGIYAGRTYRITFAGSVYVGIPVEYSTGIVGLGNAHLWHSEEYEDSGEDFCVRTWADINIFFYTRTPGTYTLKIERQITAE